MEKRQILALTVLRQKVGLTQMDLALAIGKSQTEISHWEKGDRPLPPDKAGEIMAVLRAQDRGALPTGLKPTDLPRPWDEVLLERVVASSGRLSRASKRPRLRAPAGRAASRI
jgi:transcriptional regulator with XRE-family HTH domain